MRLNAYQKIRLLPLEYHIYTHIYRYLPFDVQSDSANEPSESAGRCKAHARRLFHALQTDARASLKCPVPGSQKVASTLVDWPVRTHVLYDQVLHVLCKIVVTRVFHSSYTSLWESAHANGMPRT